jgi:alcohol dehydrogenase class IV
MRSINLRYPSKLSIGAGCIHEFINDASGSGVSSIFIVTIPETLPLIEELISGLGDKDFYLKIDDSIESEPSIADFNRVLLSAKDFEPGLVLGIGGGSALDVAKIISAQLDNTQVLEEIIGINRLERRNTQLACMPTTSGTGSEMAPNAILLDQKEQLKKGIISPFLVPDMCYIDPQLTITVPPDVTATTGMDAFTHCMEAYINRNSHPVVDSIALEGMTLIARSLLAAVKDGKDIDARMDLSLGSMYGGMCLGPVNTTAIHALSYPLGSEFHVAHGLSNALMMPYVMEFNLPVAIERYARVAEILGAGKRGNPEETARAGLEASRQLIADCGIPSTLSEIGIPREAIPRMAESAMKIQRLLVNNPREVTLEDAMEIYTKAYSN